MGMIGRRAFCQMIAVAAATAPFVSPNQARAAGGPARLPTILWVRRARDEAQIDYSTEEGYRAIAWMLRDVQADVIGLPHERLLDQWAWMQAWLAAYGYHVRFDIHSGLRTPATNRSTEGAALASYHLPDTQGVFRAGDISTPTIPWLSQQGGVGFYTRDFIHTDVRGYPVSWRSR